jgi:hypothetical protein
MEKSQLHCLDSFVARIWLEYGQNGEACWRGRIRHVQNGRQIYFQDLREMRDFLEDVSGVPGPQIAP